MRRGIISGLIFAAVFMTEGCASGDAALTECYSTKQFIRMIAPAFSCYVMNVAASGQSRIDLYLQMPYKKIRFQKEGQHYSASYSYTFLIRGENQEIIQSKDIDRSITAGSYDESISLRFDPYLQTFLLSPGTYTLEIRCRDNLSQLAYKSVYQLDARNFQNTSPSASSVLLLDTVFHDEKGFSLRPILPDNVSFLAGSLGTFQEIYNVHSGDSLKVMTYYSKVKADSSDDSFTHLMPPYKVKHPACREGTVAAYFSAESTFVATKEGSVQFIQSHPIPEAGFSSLRRTVTVRSGERIDTSVHSISLYRRDPQYKILPSPDEILFVMRYITRNEEYDSLKSSDPELQKKKLNQFWGDHGGTQRKYDFEMRINEANRLFTSCVDGSRTPMGIVYAICGTPDFIDCRGEYIENWYYTVGERTYAVQFRAVGDGDDHTYYEVTPFSINDSFWQYQVDRWRRKN